MGDTGPTVARSEQRLTSTQLFTGTKRPCDTRMSFLFGRATPPRNHHASLLREIAGSDAPACHDRPIASH